MGHSEKVCAGCGQRLAATNSKGEAACAVCFGIHETSGQEVEKEAPDEASCSSCGRPARWNAETKKWEIQTGKSPEFGGDWTAPYKDGVLPFLQVRNERVNYYCGCHGWN